MAGCPNDEIMAALSEGKLDAEQAAAVHAHIDVCQSCQWLLRELGASAAGDDATAPTVAGSVQRARTATVYGPGMVLGERYRLDRELGAGGMGVVFEATHLGTDRKVACKILRTERLGTHAARLRFLREARLLGRVEHPHLVPVRDVFDDAGTPVLVMDFLVGESLGARLEREGRMEPAEVARLLRPAMAAVHAAHAAGIVHRDLKPDNLFLVEIAPGEQSARVLDFGIAKLLDEPSRAAAPSGALPDSEAASPSTLTETGEVVGTPPYMAPEQLRGEAVDRRVDVWAFGVILYECLAGQRPFRERRLGQYFERITRGERAPLGQLVPNLPGELVELVERMLTVELAARSNDLGEAIRVLGRLASLDERGGSEAAAPPQPAAPVEASALPSTAPPGSELGPAARGRRRRYLGAALLLLLGAIGLAIELPRLLAVRQAAPRLGQPPVGAAGAAAPPSQPIAMVDCAVYWGRAASPTLCDSPTVTMRQAAVRTFAALHGSERPDGELQTALLACRGDERCLLERLTDRGTTGQPRIAVVDCNKAVSPDAKAICRSPALASAAGALAAHYQAVLEDLAAAQPRLRRLPDGRTGLVDEAGRSRVVPSAATLSSEQTAWLGERHRCGEDSACLTARMAERTATLAALHRLIRDGGE